jgi:Uma2 family endonuclease
MLVPMLDPALLHPDALAPDGIRPLRVEEYLRLAEAGAFDDEKVELLGGVVVAMSPQGDDHMHLLTLFNRFLAKRLPASFMVAPQVTYRLSEYSAPEPDFSIVSTASVWAKRQKADWLIEVAVSSLRKDRGIKAKLYANAGISEYWVIDANTMSVYVHRDPSSDRYRSVAKHDRFAQLAPAAIPDLVMSLDDLLADRIEL